MKRYLVGLAAVALVTTALVGPAAAAPKADEDLNTRLHELKWGEPEGDLVRGDPGAPGGGLTQTGPFSKTQITNFRCASSGNPAVSVDMSCNTTTYGQNWNP